MEWILGRRNAGKSSNAPCFLSGDKLYVVDSGSDSFVAAVARDYFHLETEEPNNLCGKSCELPDSLLPTAHYNYENRLYDFNDDLPKWMTFAMSQGNPGIRLTNDGKRIVS